jgi:DNA invertase Pin-like site-specific DNA recombinase
LYGHELVHVYRDEGLSASSMEREGLNSAVAHLLERGPIGLKPMGLVVSKLDRLTRSLRDLSTLLDTVFKENSLISVSENLDTTSATGRLLVNILGSVSQWEREAIAERTRDTLQHMKREGRRVGGVPYGFRADENGFLVVEEEEQRVIELARGYRDHAGFSYQDISDRLRLVDNCVSRSGRPFAPTQIKRMLAQ